MDKTHVAHKIKWNMYAGDPFFTYSPNIIGKPVKDQNTLEIKDQSRIQNFVIGCLGTTHDLALLKIDFVLYKM